MKVPSQYAFIFICFCIEHTKSTAWTKWLFLIFIRQVLITLCTKPAVLSLFSAATLLKTDAHIRDALVWEYQSFNRMKINKHKWTIFIIENCHTAKPPREYRKFNDVKINKRKLILPKLSYLQFMLVAKSGFAFISCRFGSYAALQLYITHAHTSRRLLRVFPNSSLRLCLSATASAVIMVLFRYWLAS